MQDKENDLKDIEESLDKRTEMLKNHKSGKESKERKNTKSKTTKLKQDLEQMMQSMFQQESAENYETIRQILDNLILFSNSQESIWDKLNTLDSDNPQTAEAYIEQTNLQSYFKVIEDSMLALGKRTAQLSSLINKELYEITGSFSTISQSLGDTKYGAIPNSQRDIVEHTNNLALLLNESMQDMDSQQGGEGGKPQKGKKPKPGMGDLKQQQQSLQESLQNYLDALKKNGNKKEGLGKQQADVLKQQEMFNQMLEELQKTGNFSPESQTILNQIRKQAEEGINDIVRNNISSETLFRQNQIKTRLLEAEKAQRERELDKERKSSTAVKYDFSVPDELKFEENLKNRFNEELSYDNLKFYYFYKNKYKEYLNKLVK